MFYKLQHNSTFAASMAGEYHRPCIGRLGPAAIHLCGCTHLVWCRALCRRRRRSELTDLPSVLLERRGQRFQLLEDLWGRMGIII